MNHIIVCYHSIFFNPFQLMFFQNKAWKRCLFRKSRHYRAKLFLDFDKNYSENGEKSLKPVSDVYILLFSSYKTLYGTRRFCVSLCFCNHLRSGCYLVLVLYCSGGCLLCMLCFLHELFPLIWERFIEIWPRYSCTQSKAGQTEGHTDRRTDRMIPVYAIN